MATPTDAPLPVLLLVHGAFHGPWCFDPILPGLAAHDISTATVELPLTTFAAGTAAVVEAIESITRDGDREVVLLGHSYGGAVVTAAGVHPRVSSLIYLTAMAPASGQATSGTPEGSPVAVGDEFIRALQFGEDGLLSIDPDRAPALFYPDTDDALAAEWAARLRRGGTGVGEIVERAAWEDTPSSYIVCTDDPVIGVGAQRALAARCGATTYEMPGDHSPFLARPDELVALLATVLTAR